MNRRFVNLLVAKWCAAPRPSFKLHRIDPAILFHPTGSPKPEDPPAEIVAAPGRLPSAAISFDWPYNRHQTGWIDFMAYKDNNIVAVDHEGRTLLYDCAAQAIRAMPQTDKPRAKTISLTVGDDLYVIGREPGKPPQWHHFQALVYGSPRDLSYSEEWYWRLLQQPSFDYPDHQTDPTTYTPAELANPYAINSYTLVGDSQIWISTVAGGTYSYHTAASGEWYKVRLSALPFRGRAEYVPEHGLWFGFSSEDELQLCAADLSLTRPVPHLLWEGPPLPESWSLAASSLLPMGSGRFCVARVFERGELSPPGCTKAERFAVLSGVEVFSAAGGIESLQVIEHKSRCYRLGNHEVRLL